MTLIERAAEIDRKHRRVVKTTQNAVTRWIALGHELVAAKKQVRDDLGARKWLVWLAENTEVSERTTQIAIGFATHETQLNEWLRGKIRNVADLSIRDANQIISAIKKAKSGNGSGGDGNNGGGDQDPGGDGDGTNGNGVNGDGANGNDDPGEDDPEEDGPDEKQFEALREAYEEASLEVRDRFHKHLGEIHGLEVRSIDIPQQQAQLDDSAGTAAADESEPHAEEAVS